MTDLYEYPSDHIGTRSYVSVRGHTRSIPRYKCYRGSDGYNYILPEYGGEGSDNRGSSAYYMPDQSAYLSPVDGTYVTSRSQHREHCKRNGVIEAGDMPPPTEQKNRDAHGPVTGRDIVEAINACESR